MLWEVDGLEKTCKKFKQDLGYAHFPDSCTIILAPLVNGAIVARFQSFNDQVLQKCFADARSMWRPLRPPALLHSVGTLDLWNFVFSAFDAILGFQIPLELCLGVFCNFLNRTAHQFAEVAAEPERLTLGVFPLLAKAKRIFSDIRLPDEEDSSSDGEVTAPGARRGRGDHLPGSAREHFETSLSPNGGRGRGGQDRAGSVGKLPWFKNKMSGAALRSGSRKRISGEGGTSCYKFQPFARKNQALDPAEEANVAALERSLPPMAEIVVRARSLVFSLAQLQVLREHIATQGSEEGEQEMLVMSLLRCRETIMVGLMRLLAFVSAYMVHVELGKALFTSLYVAPGGGGSGTAEGAEEGGRSGLGGSCCFYS